MNKKFLSAILFGALMVTSTGTFVSCKDYDDDTAPWGKKYPNGKEPTSTQKEKEAQANMSKAVLRSLMVMVVMKSNSVMERPLNYTMVQKGEQGEPGKPGTPGTQVLLLMIM